MSKGKILHYSRVGSVRWYKRPGVLGAGFKPRRINCFLATKGWRTVDTQDEIKGILYIKPKVIRK